MPLIEILSLIDVASFIQARLSFATNRVKWRTKAAKYVLRAEQHPMCLS